MIGNASVTILRPTAGAADRNHDRVPGTPERIPVPGAAWAPRSSTDLRSGGRTGAITGRTVYMPPGTDVQAGDAIELDGIVFEIDGVPGEWTNPFDGFADGIEVPVRRADG